MKLAPSLLSPARLPARSLAIATLALAASVGCNKKADTAPNYTGAINTYYSAHPVCLWDAPRQLPAQANTSGGSPKTSEFDALVDQGLLVRTTAEKKVFIVASRQVNNYDLSDKGRSAWTADPQQPGFGNFCYGHRKVSIIDSSTPSTADSGATTEVAFHTTLEGAPGWATAAETLNAFPNLHTDLSAAQPAQATLINTSKGWQVVSTASSARRSPVSSPASSVDGQIVK